MARSWRLGIFQGVAGALTFVFAVLSLALLDLVGGMIPAGGDSMTSASMGDAAFGIIGVVLVSPAYAVQAVRRQALAPLHQLACVVVALFVASVWCREPAGMVGAVIVSVPVILVWLLNPDRPPVVRRPSKSASVPMLVCALAFSVPAWWFGGALARNGRAGLPPTDSFAFVPSFWSAVIAMLVATSLVAFVAAPGESGWWLSTGCVAVSALLFGLACIIYPDAPASAGRGWGITAVAWSAVWVAVARYSRSSLLRALWLPRTG